MMAFFATDAIDIHSLQDSDEPLDMVKVIGDWSLTGTGCQWNLNARTA